jgi:hypothetical protein
LFRYLPDQPGYHKRLRAAPLLAQAIGHLARISQLGGHGTCATPSSLLMSDGVPIEEIARLAGHNRTATTGLVTVTNCAPSSLSALRSWIG